MQKPTFRRLISTSFAIAAAITISAPTTLTAQGGPGGSPAEAAEEKAALDTLKVGDKVPSISTEGVEYIKGETVTALDEAGKVYMIECWATWCGPCITAIPHINGLHEKFADKGLVVLGMNVFEDGLEKVQDFVKNQGDNMSYRVAYSGGRESEFSKTWLQPAGVNGIPHAFFVKDGILIAMQHPASVDEKLITQFLSDDFDSAAYAKEQAAKEARQKELDAKIMPFFQSQDWEGLKKFVTEELTAEEDKEARDELLAMAAVQLGDWAAIAKSAAAAEDGMEKEQLFGQAAFVAPNGEGAKAAAEAALEVFSKDAFENAEGDQESLMKGLARLRYLSMAGKKEDATALVASLKDLELQNPQMKAMATTVIEKAAEALEGEDAIGPIQAMMR